jgi:hypothetical protein
MIRLPRFRVRTLLVLVAGAAVLIWGLMMGARSFEFYRRAREHGANERGWREIAARGRRDAKFASECTEYFARLTRKYRRAMWRPWMPVASDAHAPGYDQWVEQERRAKEAAADPPAPPRRAASP